MTQNSEELSIQHDGSVTIHQTCAGSQRLVVTHNLPPVQSWMTSHTANTARL
jgi:hypothetical protein